MTINEIAAELKINLTRAVEEFKSQEDCDRLVNAFIKQLAEGDFSKSAIRKSIPKIVREVKSQFDGRDFGEELNSVNTSTYVDKVTGETVEKSYQQHYIFTKLYSDFNTHGLVTGNEPGNFTLDKPEVEAEVIEVKTAEKKITKKSDLIAKVGTVDAIDFAKYLKIANSLLASNNWEDRVIGVQMAIPRRDSEIGLGLEFYVDSKFSVCISTPSKKKDEKGTFYRLPCFVDSQIIIDAIAFIRENKPESLSDVHLAFGDNLAANVSYNNSERKKVEQIYNSAVRALIPSSASYKGRDNRHQLKAIGTSALYQIKSNSLGNLAGQKHVIDSWVRDAVAHEFESTTNKYLTWNVTNISQELNVIANLTYGQVSPEYLGIETEALTEGNEMKLLFESLLKKSINDSDKVTIIEQLFLNSQGELKDIESISSGLNKIFEVFSNSKNRDTKIHKALGLKPEKSLTELRVEALIDAVIIHNENAQDALKVHISDSSIRGFFIVFNGTVNINAVHSILENNTILRVKIDDRNKDLTSDQNLRWRKMKDKIVVSLRQILQENFPDVL